MGRGVLKWRASQNGKKRLSGKGSQAHQATEANLSYMCFSFHM